MNFTGPEGEECSPRRALMAELADLLNEYTEALEPVEILLILQLFVKETEAFIPKENN